MPSDALRSPTRSRCRRSSPTPSPAGSPGSIPTSLQVLRVVGVTGGDLPTVAAVCQSLGLRLDGLERAEGLRIVTLTPYRVEFTHPLVGSAVVAGIPAVERRRLHALAADAVPPGEADRRAWHRSEATLGLDDEVAAEARRRGPPRLHAWCVRGGVPGARARRNPLHGILGASPSLPRRR